MRRSDLRQRMQQRPALAKYRATRLLQTPTMTAVRFLEKLGLITRHSHLRDRGVRSLRSTLIDYQVSPDMEVPRVLERPEEFKTETYERAEAGIQADEFAGEDLLVAELMGRTEETTTEKSPLPLSANRFTPKPVPQSQTRSTRESSPLAKVESHTDSPPNTIHNNPAELFSSRDSDRSPLSWLARLVDAAGPQPDAEPIKEPHNIGPPPSILRTAAAANRLARGSQHRSLRSLPQVEQPQTLSPATRRFLKPLVGIDPATVPIYAGSSAAQVVSNNQADALTVSEVVALGPDHAGESPEQLGVLAHELTHVVRQRQPRFVPPIASHVPAQSLATVAPETMDEEALARRVESRVIRTAKADENRASSPGPMTINTESRFAPDAIEPLPSESSAAAPDWGGLPAPWEPLPEWISAPTGESVSSAPDAVTTNATDISLADGSSSVSSGRVHFAGEGRSLEEDRQSAYGVHDVRAAESARQVAPDLDAMAQQVYSILKRRLAVERRRESVLGR